MTEAASTESLRVLVVDDSLDLAESLAACLELLGCEVRSATDGSAALQLLDQWQPRMAFIDLTMPGMSGMQVLGRVREHHSGRLLTAIAMTGLSSRGERERALTDGFDEFVQKPFDLEDLRTVLRLVRD